ncbi:MAG: DUF4286 family protein [Myxococcota bacterium]|jgi:hypothetical protein|nr:DUF4286 family protein [Myxococcota bacterium]
MLYIVRVWVDKEVAEDWRVWMRDIHIPEVVETGCFVRAYMARNEDADTEQRVAWVMMYHAPSAEDYARYKQEHAAALQADHTERYAGRVNAERELLPVHATFPGE